MRPVLVVAACLLLAGCATFQKELRAARSDYEKLMSQGAHHGAMTLAKKKGLGREAVVRAALADMRQDAETGVAASALTTANAAGLTRSEETAFAQDVFGRLVRANECAKATEVAFFFDLGRRHLEAGIACVRERHGLSAALALACRRAGEDVPLGPYFAEFERQLDSPSGDWYDGVGDIVAACRFDGHPADEKLFARLLAMPDRRLALAMLEPARAFPGSAVGLRKIFDASVAAGDLDSARSALFDERFVKTAVEERIFARLALDRFECSATLADVHDGRLSSLGPDEVFSDPKCAGSDLAEFAWKLASEKDDVVAGYRAFALRYGKFRLAWHLSDRFGRKALDEVKEAVFRAKAHLVLLELSPPTGTAKDDFMREVFEDAIDHGEEWFAATFAKANAPEPETVVERAYLSALERGEWLMAAQISEKYGDPDRRAMRARLAFEMAMLARDPLVAQDILRTSGLEDDERHRRAALLRYEIKRERERSERKKRKKKGTSGDWDVRRE